METIKIGSKGDAVKSLQRCLNLQADGIFGPLTDEAVRQFQKEHGLQVDGIVGPKTWAMIQTLTPASSIPTPNTIGGLRLRKSTRKINKLIVHCSATAEGKDYDVATITKWHLQRGFSTIGYHYVIYRDGSVHEGRNINTSGAHTTGYNQNSVGICYIGGCAADGKTAKDTRTAQQRLALTQLLKELKKFYPSATIHGHREFANKACPSFDARSEYKNI